MFTLVRTLLVNCRLIAIATGILEPARPTMPSQPPRCQDNNHRYVAAIWAGDGSGIPLYSNPRSLLFRFLMAALFVHRRHGQAIALDELPADAIHRLHHCDRAHSPTTDAGCIRHPSMRQGTGF